MQVLFIFKSIITAHILDDQSMHSVNKREGKSKWHTLNDTTSKYINIKNKLFGWHNSYIYINVYIFIYKTDLCESKLYGDGGNR